MTDEEKVKAYDEAVRKGLNAIKKIEDYGDNTSVSIKALKGLYIDLFPEIGVIDDEITNLEIIEYFNLVRTKSDDAAKKLFDRWIEYLEKQKEQKPVDEEELSKFCEANFNAGKRVVLNNPEEYGLQKPTEWSKEDEAHRKFILESLEDQIRFCKKDAEGAYYAKQIRTAQNWLNNLPLRFKNQ